MRVTLKTLMAGPDLIVQPGETVDLPDDRAAELVEGGYATAEATPAVETPATTTEAEPGGTATPPRAAKIAPRAPAK